MDKKQIQDMILPEEDYAQAMDEVVAPYLEKRMGVQYREREAGKKIYLARALSDEPRGIVVMSHGYTETIEKHRESIYYFLRGGYHVFMPEHCGHGRSYRLCSDREDLSLVFVDDYIRYVEDLLYVCRLAAQEFPQLPLYLYGHSMGGGIAAAAAAKAPELFAGSASISEARFAYYQKKRNSEPLFQMSAGSFGWLWQAVRLHRFLLGSAWHDIACPVLVFQAEQETYVSNEEQARFVKKMNGHRKDSAELVRFLGVKHEIFNADREVLEDYWMRIFAFLIANRSNLQ